MDIIACCQSYFKGTVKFYVFCFKGDVCDNRRQLTTAATRANVPASNNAA